MASDLKRTRNRTFLFQQQVNSQGWRRWPTVCRPKPDTSGNKSYQKAQQNALRYSWQWFLLFAVTCDTKSVLFQYRTFLFSFQVHTVYYLFSFFYVLQILSVFQRVLVYLLSVQALLIILRGRSSFFLSQLEKDNRKGAKPQAFSVGNSTNENIKLTSVLYARLVNRGWSTK